MQIFFDILWEVFIFVRFPTAVIMKPNDIVTLDIEQLGDDGDGIAQLGRYTVYVHNALPGERVCATIADVAKTYAHAELKRVVQRSPYSRQPFCQHYEECGGCQIQRMSYRGQLIQKRKKIIETLKSAGVQGDDIVPEVIACQMRSGFRNKAIFPVAKNADGEIVAGFYARRSHNIVPAKECPVGVKENFVVLNIIIGHLRRYNIEPYDEATHSGLVRYIMIRKAFATGQLMVSIVLNGNSIPHHKELVDSLLAAKKGVKDISIIVNCDNTNRIRGNEVITLYGDGYITEHVNGIKFRISPLSFFQVNTPQTEVLYRTVWEFSGFTMNDTIFDIYCGVGTISLFMARDVRKVIGVESIPQAVDDAKRNALLNRIFNADFLTGKAEEVIPDLVNNKGVRADIVIVDPPRKGCDKALLDTIIQMRPKRLVYVSCDPKSLARDLRYLQDNGFKTKHVQPVDMFPHTVHVESVALVEIC